MSAAGPQTTMDRPGLTSLWVLLALLALRASGTCTSYGVDYSNGGSYYIDGSSNQYFSFVTVFQGKTGIVTVTPWAVQVRSRRGGADARAGCSQETISPVLVGPDGSVYTCSAIQTEPAGTQVTSTW